MTPRWFPLAAVGIHAALATMIVGSILVMLLGSSRSGDEVGLIGGWTRTLGLVTESLGMVRRRPYALALLGTFALLSTAVGCWDAWCVLRGRRTSSLALVVPLVALISLVIYATTIEVLLHVETFYVTVMASNYFWFSYVVVVLYGVLYVPVALLATRVVRSLHIRCLH